MADCVGRFAGRPIERVRVNTLGGDVRSALSIADTLAAAEPVVEVIRFCASSCANYVLPVARRVEVAPDAVVILHGSVDEGLLRRVADDPHVRERSRELVDAQEAFRQRHGVHPGWLLLREDYERTPLSPHIEGDVRDFDGEEPRHVRGFAVRPGFAQSCLPDVPFVWRGSTDPSPETRRNLDRNGWADTLAMRCRDGDLL